MAVRCFQILGVLCLLVMAPLGGNCLDSKAVDDVNLEELVRDVIETAQELLERDAQIEGRIGEEIRELGKNEDLSSVHHESVEESVEGVKDQEMVERRADSEGLSDKTGVDDEANHEEKDQKLKDRGGWPAGNGGMQLTNQKADEMESLQDDSVEEEEASKHQEAAMSHEKNVVESAEDNEESMDHNSQNQEEEKERIIFKDRREKKNDNSIILGMSGEVLAMVIVGVVAAGVIYAVSVFGVLYYLINRSQAGASFDHRSESLQDEIEMAAAPQTPSARGVVEEDEGSYSSEFFKTPKSTGGGGYGRLLTGRPAKRRSWD